MANPKTVSLKRERFPDAMITEKIKEELGRGNV